MDSKDSDQFVRSIVALFNQDDSNELQKDPKFAELFDLALRYLDND